MQQFSVGSIKTRGMLIAERRLGRPIEEYLRERYEADRRTTQQIADELGISNGTVSRWMAHLGIEARYLGSRRAVA